LLRCVIDLAGPVLTCQLRNGASRLGELTLGDNALKLVVLGPYVLGIFGERTPIADSFAELGKLLLTFFAGLEIDVAQFRRAQNKSMVFGLVTTSIPLLLGAAVGLLFGYQPVAAIVLGSLLASHTLLSRL